MADQADTYSQPDVPLVVDLDGTLVSTDLLLESSFLLARKHPLQVLKLPLWLARGKAYLKHRLARLVSPETHTLPYNQPLVEYLRSEKLRGRHLVLATASDERIAQSVADELDLFDTVVASDGSANLSGWRKGTRLVEAFGSKGFDYAGNSRKDFPVWREAREAILVNAAPRVRKAAERRFDVEKIFTSANAGGSAYWHALRPHQWLKNMLVFVPLAASHQLYDIALLAQAALAFVAFSLCASSVYVLNDLLDLPSDRRHPHKKDRPVASGQIPLSHAVAMTPLLLVMAAAVGLWLPPAFLAVLGVYYGLTLAYSLHLKDVVMLDVLVLATGYTLRVLAGGAAVEIAPSPWLLAFCVFLFFSLALTKRYAELVTMRTAVGARARARAYLLEDAELLAALGGASGYLSVLVLALYITGDMVRELYGRHELIWLVCLLLLYWISHLWLMAHRGRMHDDPLVFALRDGTSRITLIAMILIGLAAV
ncbi:MAG: UbiA family prenyltransferase [Pseudomonadota bacterium]